MKRIITTFLIVSSQCDLLFPVSGANENPSVPSPSSTTQTQTQTQIHSSIRGAWTSRQEWSMMNDINNGNDMFVKDETKDMSNQSSSTQGPPRNLQSDPNNPNPPNNPNNPNNPNHPNNENTNTSGGNQRQVIHVFFHEFENNPNDMAKERDMLQNWKIAWTEMGWEPRVIGLEDAKRHPKYWEYERDLNQVPLQHPHKLTEKSRMLYLRWLAMASVGGGWLADYDTIPLRPPLPTDQLLGKFHIYESPGIPSLLSGSAGEWTRMADMILRMGVEHTESPHWSDTMGLVSILHSGKCDCALFDIVMEASDVLTGGRPGGAGGRPGRAGATNGPGNTSPYKLTPADCNRLKNHLAVHFSTHSIINADLELDYRRKPQIIKEWGEAFRSQCQVQVPI